MDFKIILLIFTSVICECYSQDEFNVCDVTYTGDNPDDVQIDWQYGLMRVKNINDVDKLDLTFTYEGTLHVVPANEDGAKYIDIKVDDTFLTIQTNDYFRDHFDEDMRSQPTASQLPISRKFQLTCNEERPITFSFTLYVTDTNNYIPQFFEETYFYTIPMPLKPETDLTLFGDQIIAEDIDFSDTEITFSVDSNNFIVETENLENRQYRAILKVKESISYHSEVSLTITALDGGTPQLSSAAEIRIASECTLPETPKFSSLLFRFTFFEDGLVITPTDGNTIMVTSNNPDQVVVVLDDETYIKPVYNFCTRTVTLKSTGIPIPRTLQELPLILTAEVGGASGQAVVLISANNA